MTVFKRLLLVTVLLSTAGAWGQSPNSAPQIGYLYPSGGQQGTTFHVAVAGQLLRGPKEVLVTGEGVTAEVVKYVGRMRPPNNEQVRELQRRMAEVRDARVEEAIARGEDLPKKLMDAYKRDLKRAEAAEAAKAKTQSAELIEGSGTEDAEEKPKAKETPPSVPVSIPSHPMFHDLENMSLRELQHIQHIIQNYRKNQRNPQLAESLIIKITIAPDAPIGDRQVRLKTQAGLTNPMCFEVGGVPELRELEPNDPNAQNELPPPPPLELPVVLNGQIMPGDADLFRFQAEEGQKLVIAASARKLVPYLADAVPGWFQATLTLRDEEGREVAFVDDYQFHPDPVLLYEVPEDGVYELEVRDAIYRGRDDFVYRISVGERPFVTHAFPLGGRPGEEVEAKLDGWNLPSRKTALDTDAPAGSVRQAVLREGNWTSNSITYAVDGLPECVEDEPNDVERKAQRVKLPVIVNGRIEEPGDVDLFEFKGEAGDEVVAEISARRLNSPLDSLVRVLDEDGNVLDWNDDCMHKEGHLHTDEGLITHHADSYLSVTLPGKGVYRVQVSDSQQHGGDAYAYRLRVSPPRPDFALRATPSALTVPVGRAEPISVYVCRKDGFDEEIEVVLKDAPDGYELIGGTVPSGRDCIRMTLLAPLKADPAPFSLRLEGRAQINGETMVREAEPTDDTMQAFLWRHLAPADEFVVTPAPGRRTTQVRLVEKGRVSIPAGGYAELHVKAPKDPILNDIGMELSDPPEGLSIEGVKVVPDGLAFLLKAEGDALEPGLKDNLIVSVYAERMVKSKRSGAEQKQRIALGYLPAIPFEVVPQ